MAISLFCQENRLTTLEHGIFTSVASSGLFFTLCYNLGIQRVQQQ
jgi:hypothetical protein